MTTYSINIDNEGRGSVTATENGEIIVVTSDDPLFTLYMDAAIQGKPLSEIKEAGVPNLTPLTELSERVFVNEDTVEFDGEPVHDTLAKTIQRYWLEGRPYGGLVRFMERLSLNTCEHSRNALWDWVRDRDLEVDNEGFLIAYKGVRTDLTSVNSGPALVDDIPMEGHIPNQEGSVISMPRSQVQHDPAVACGTGLHVGTKSYAQSFGQVLLTCRVDPVDVVSVPTDCGGQKMRTCRYKVIDVHDPHKQYEPVATDDPAYESVEERIEEATPEAAKSFVKAMLDKIRRGR